MGTTGSLIRVVKSRVRQAVYLALATFIGWTSLAQVVACTPSGMQCPTASIQSILETAQCCGKTVVVSARKPQPGDKGFVQCRCAEKRSSQQQARLGPGSTHIEFLVTDPYDPSFPERIPEAAVASTVPATIVAVPSAPFVPPPSLV